MWPSDLHGLLLILVVAGVTALLRFTPFWIFRGKESTPGFVLYLGKALPYAIMGMLIIYCLKNVNVRLAPHGIPEFLGVMAVVGLHLWKRNTLLSIGAGTVLYMLLVQMVF